MKLRRKLFASKDPYDCTRSQLFLDACKENYGHLITHCDDYRKISEGLGIKGVSDISSVADLPVIPTMLMKQHDFRSGRYMVMATSSGTSGKMSHVRFEFGALMAALRMSIKVTRYHGIMSFKPCRYIVMGYKPHRSNKTAVAKTAYLTTFLAPAISRKFILKHTADGYKPDFDGIVEALKKYEKGKAPVRFMGFPSYTFFLFRILEERGLSFKLPKNSRIMLGGGWKQFYQEAADKETFYKLAKKTCLAAAGNSSTRRRPTRRPSISSPRKRSISTRKTLPNSSVRSSTRSFIRTALRTTSMFLYTAISLSGILIL